MYDDESAVLAQEIQCLIDHMTKSDVETLKPRHKNFAFNAAISSLKRIIERHEYATKGTP